MTNNGTIPVTSSGGTNLPFINYAKEELKTGLAILRPWKEMARLINHPASLMVFVALLFAFSSFLYFLRDKPLAVLHNSIHHNTVMFILSIVTVILLLFTGAVLSVISALLIAAFIVEIHAFFRKTEDLFLDEEAAEAAGLITSSPA
ncbi:hypothetical protein ACET3Z_007679 [Daucus carota]